MTPKSYLNKLKKIGQKKAEQFIKDQKAGKIAKYTDLFSKRTMKIVNGSEK